MVIYMECKNCYEKYDAREFTKGKFYNAWRRKYTLCDNCAEQEYRRQNENNNPNGLNERDINADGEWAEVETEIW